MSTWNEMAREARSAAGSCLREELYRSCVSRAYYATFSAITAALHEAGVTVPKGRNAWAHAALPKLIRDHLGDKLGRHRARELMRMVRENYVTRLSADYVSEISITKESARRCLTNATTVTRQCGGAS